LKTLIVSRPPDLRALCEKLLEVRGLGVVAARGLALSEDPAIGVRLAKAYRKFSPQERTALLDTLVARPAFAKALLDEMAAGAIAKTDLTAFHARQIRGFEDEALTQQLVEVWGELRESAADKKALVEKLKGDLKPEVLASANLGNGRALYAAVCGACHTMYGEGGKIGPDLTGSGRANLDYLLENIVDPSAVVSADYRMSLVTLEDGRALSGVIAGKDERTLTLRTLAETMTIDQKEVVKIDTSPMSMMPEGLLLAFPPEQVRDLIAYLMHPVQVPLPGAQ
jgi:putative heme-binding domain-containing protein